MPSQGPNYPGSVSVSKPAVDSAIWFNPDDSRLEDFVECLSNVIGPGKLTDLLEFSNYGFSLPEGATVDGVLVGVKKRIAGYPEPPADSVKDYLVEMTVLGSANKASVSNWPGGFMPSWVNYGGAADSWDVILTDTEVNDSAFGLNFGAQNTDGSSDASASLDATRITIYYSEAEPEPEPEPEPATPRRHLTIVFSYEEAKRLGLI